MGVVDPRGHDVRIDLELLDNQTLYDLARNADARHRLLAIRILLERKSAYVFKPEIKEDAAGLT